MTATAIKRRIFLQGLAASPVFAAFNWPLTSLAASANLSVLPINDRISLLAGAGGNVVLYKGNQGVTLVDSGSKEQVAALLKLVDELRGQSLVSTLINTHWHEDHTGGNEAVRALGANIIAHVNTKLWLGADFDVEWRNWTHKPRPAAALPDQTFYTSEKLDLGGETVECDHFQQAHTDGDIAVFFSQSNVLVAGGLLSNYRYPIADIATGGWIGGLLNANKALLARINDNTVIIPDRGSPLSKLDLQAQHDMLADLYEKMKKLAQEGFSGHDMLQEKLTAQYDERWGDPEEFLLETYRGMWAHTYDMGGFI
jgi:glyoxylase-like metal-dependent hydrolase (beta-lactamase superfamily II)